MWPVCTKAKKSCFQNGNDNKNFTKAGQKTLDGNSLYLYAILTQYSLKCICTNRHPFVYSSHLETDFPAKAQYYKILHSVSTFHVISKIIVLHTITVWKKSWNEIVKKKLGEEQGQRYSIKEPGYEVAGWFAWSVGLATSSRGRYWGRLQSLSRTLGSRKAHVQ